MAKIKYFIIIENSLNFDENSLHHIIYKVIAFNRVESHLSSINPNKEFGD